MTQKTIHEAFAKFFENPRRDTLRNLLKEHSGELRHCDFKEIWPENGQLAKHLLGLANSGGGCLVIGVKELDDKSLEATGLCEFKDKAVVHNSVKYYLPESLLQGFEIGDFQFDASEFPTLVGKKFQAGFVTPKDSDIPFVARKTGTGVREGAIYIRQEGLTEEAGYDQVQALLEKRLIYSLPSTQARHLLEHLEELKLLYKEIPKTFSTAGPGIQQIIENFTRPFSGLNLTGPPVPNLNYPKEDYPEFIAKMIESKKAFISKLLLRE